jgi:hypothetical protein
VATRGGGDSHLRSLRRRRVLFVGLPSSSHTRSWIDLLDESEFDVRLFGLPEGYPPEDWRVMTYLTTPHLPRGLDRETRSTLYPTPEEVHARQRGLRFFIQRAARKGELVTERLVGGFAPLHVGFAPVRAGSAEEWLAKILREWHPDIIHTLGLDGAGLFYFDVRTRFRLEHIGRWVLQLRGGSDLELNRLGDTAAARLRPALRECDQILSDNLVNHRYVLELGARPEQLAPLNPVPGTGGVAVDELASLCVGKPSLRERIIVWPKSYESPWSKALPVLEALRIAWPKIRPVRVYMLATNEEPMAWVRTLPSEIRHSCTVLQGVPRSDVLTLMSRARLVLAPSIVDGVPNVLYEAMACGAFPIVSPLETILALVSEPENVLFARNLYPSELAEALTRSMNDDGLVDEAADRNLILVRKVADRETIREKAVSFYRAIGRMASVPDHDK